MAKLNRADIIKKLHKVLKKHFTPVPTPHDRTVLEHVLFACCLEDTRHELAEECFARVQQLYFDWNEIRVTTTRELSEVFASLPDPMAAATRLKSSLQSIFETRYEFDLEFLKKMKLGDAQKKLASLRGPSLFVQAYVTQASLGGHAIPTSAGSLQVLELVGAATGAEVAGGSVPGLDRAIPKNQGIEFGSLLHTLGSHFTADPKSTLVKSVLAEINPEATDRLAKLLARKAAPPPEPTPAPASRRPDKTADKTADRLKEDDKPAAKVTDKGAAKTESAGKSESAAKTESAGKGTGSKSPAGPTAKHASPDKASDKASDKTTDKQAAEKQTTEKGRPAAPQPAAEGPAKGGPKSKAPAAVTKETKKPAAASKLESAKPESGKAGGGAKPISGAKPGDPKSASAKPTASKPHAAQSSGSSPSGGSSGAPSGGQAGAAKSGSGKTDAGKNKPDAGKSPGGKPEVAKPTGHKPSSSAAKPPTKKPAEGKSSEGKGKEKGSDAGASKSKNASKQLTRRKPR